MTENDQPLDNPQFHSDASFSPNSSPSSLSLADKLGGVTLIVLVVVFIVLRMKRGPSFTLRSFIPRRRAAPDRRRQTPRARVDPPEKEGLARINTKPKARKPPVWDKELGLKEGPQGTRPTRPPRPPRPPKQQRPPIPRKDVDTVISVPVSAYAVSRGKLKEPFLLPPSPAVSGITTSTRSSTALPSALLIGIHKG
ncbi:hypothetical protein EYZ11_007353 [Aspergillus tanneri]|uniref:Uncharacterized protein n=1 Tax=Aspergillus tanneri TaxID=1220188 RepID=A0A4V3UP04_9EURO|nr:hypothetical protein EYZ11_007353 [Aspergillus tanneri]